MNHTRPDQSIFTWEEQWFVTRSQSLTVRQQASLQRRLERTEQELRRLRPKKAESLPAFTHRAHRILSKRRMAEFLQVRVDETTATHKRYLTPGRPAPDTPFTVETSSRLSLTVTRDEKALATARELAGWRIHVSNASPQQMDLIGSVRYYGKNGWSSTVFIASKRVICRPCLSICIPQPDTGLMLLLLIALQALTHRLRGPALFDCGEHLDCRPGPWQSQDEDRSPFGRTAVGCF